MTDFEERLRSTLAGIELTEQEDRYIYWLSGWDLETIETFAGLFEKCRADRPVGRWICGQDEQDEWYCSECKTGVLPADWFVTPIEDGQYYCPHCGAKMEDQE